jgi:ATP adenylyltransferase/5',5'''-P-1,P-4-tetraphosphate phosphorylase II
MVKDLIKKKKMIVKRTCCWHQFSIVDKFTIIITEKEKSQQKKITNTNYSI